MSYGYADTLIFEVNILSLHLVLDSQTAGQVVCP